MEDLIQKAAEAYAVVSSSRAVMPSAGGGFSWLWSLLVNDWGHDGLDTHETTARHLKLAIEYMAEIFKVSITIIISHSFVSVSPSASVTASVSPQHR